MRPMVRMNKDCEVGLCHGDRGITTNPAAVSIHPTTLAGVLNMKKTATLSTINTNVIISKIFKKKTQHMFIATTKDHSAERNITIQIFSLGHIQAEVLVI